MVKIYCDSRNRASGTNEDFVWQIPESIDLPESLAHIDVVLVPNVFSTIRAGYNDKIRFIEQVVTQAGGGATIHGCQATIAPGQYNGITLATAVQTAMRAVTNMTPPDHLKVEYDTIHAKLKFQTDSLHGSQVDIYPDGLLTSGTNNFNSAQGAHTVDPNNTQSAGKVCGLLGDAIISAIGSTTPLGDSVVDVQRHHCCYIHSDLGALGSSYGPQGQSDIIRRVIIDAPQNGLAIDRFTSPNDTVEVNARTLRSMSFRLAGADGETVDLHGHHFSFSLIFQPKI